VSSAPLRLELAEFHAERLLAALKARLPNDPVTSLRFAPEADTSSDSNDGPSHDGPSSDASTTAHSPEGRS
jgi:hypothetical protein